VPESQVPVWPHYSREEVLRAQKRDEPHDYLGTFVGARRYVLETFACLPQLPCVPAPFAQGTGQIVRVGRDGSRTVIATSLTFPTSMRFGPDGALYVSNKGYNLPPGSGEILRIAID